MDELYEMIMTMTKEDRDIEISLAALEHRFPEIGKRASPNQNQDAFGHG